MGRRKKQFDSAFPNHWKKDSQKPHLNLSSGPARVRYFRQALIGITLASLLLFVGWVGYLLFSIWENRMASYAERNASTALPELAIKGNIHIPIEVLENWVSGELRSSLRRVHPFKVQQALESRGHVASAVVRKRFPNTLEIEIRERTPVVMLATMDDNEELEFWGVDRGGVVFKAYDLAYLRRLGLPFLEGIVIAKVEDGQTHIDGVEKVHYLLQLLRHEAPKVHGDIRSVSLAKYGDGIAELGSVIVLNNRTLPSIVFSVDSMEFQLVKLLSVLNVQETIDFRTKNVIDLSISSDAIIR